MDRQKYYDAVKKQLEPNIFYHSLALETCMAGLYDYFQANNLLTSNDPLKEDWMLAGLLHDIDYEMYPEQHCIKAREILGSREWHEAYIHAVESHGWKLCCDVEPIEKMEKVLYTIDELTGLIAATAIMRPSKSILDMEVKSVKKKWKQKGFAAGVNREVIEEGAGLLGMELDKVIEETIKGMQQVAEEIGLKGNI